MHKKEQEKQDQQTELTHKPEVHSLSMTAHFHSNALPSTWVTRWSHLIAPNGTVLDVACGHGRHARWLSQQNHSVVVVDKSQASIESITIPEDASESIVADIENGPWPFIGRQFDAVIVVNYLWRPLMPVLIESLAPGGVLIYETFTQGNETVGKPSNSDFLLCPGELLKACSGLRVVAFEDGFQEETDAQKARFVQRITAVREGLSNSASQKTSAALPTLLTRFRLA